MSELTNIHARAVKDLTTPTELPVDHDALNQVKLVAGNFPAEYAGNEAMTVGMIKDLAAQGREEELEAVNLKIANEEIRAKEVEAALIKDKANKATTLSGYGIVDGYTQAQIDSKVKNLEGKKANKVDVDTALSNLSTTANKYYPTLTAANADIANIALNQSVTIGEEANKGLWEKKTTEATSLTKSAYDPLTQSQKYTDSALDIAKKFTEGKVKEVKANLYDKIGENILNVLDSENKLTMYLDQYSQLFLTGVDKSVQAYIGDIESIKDTLGDKEKENLVEFTDAIDGLYAYFSENAHLFLAELTQSVQAILNSDNLSAKSNQFVHDKKSVIANEVQPYLLSCLSGGGIIAPMPFSLAPHQFKPPTDLINVKVTQGQRLTVDTVYRKDDGVVHPHILEFRNGFLGYRYILGLTPYFLTQDKYENPCIYGSHDLLNFELIDKFPQPFSEQPIVEFENQYAYNSDDFFTYDFYSGELLFCWRRTYDNVEPRNEIWCSRTKNGLDWTAEELIYDGKTLGGILISPSIIFNFETGLYELYIVEGTASGWRIRRMTSPTLKNPRWTHSKYFQPIPNANIWHFEVRWVGSELFGLGHDDSMTGSDSSKNLYLCKYDKVSDEFVWSDKVITGEHYDPYKATFVPILNLENNTIALQILWSSRSGGDENMWKLYSSKSNAIEL